MVNVLNKRPERVPVPMITPELVTPDMRAYQPRGAAKRIFYDTRREILLSGPTRTGKSRACLEKIFAICQLFPGVRVLIVRKTRESLRQTGEQTWRDEVAPPGSYVFSHENQEFRFPNGSRVVLGGLDKPTKIMSGEYDLIYIQEATEVDIRDWEYMLTRLSGYHMPYNQLIADCNPDAPEHWLYQRVLAGHVHLYNTDLRDNPRFYEWDPATRRGRWTARGSEYRRTLDALTGVRRRRLRDGIWCAAEGQVYEIWDAAVHLIDRIQIPAEWPRFLAIDFGYRNPFVCQWHALDPDGTDYLYRELYGTGRLVSDWAADIWDHSQGEDISAVITDHDAEDRATLEDALGCDTIPAYKAIESGIQLVTARLRIQPNGRAGLYVLRDSLANMPDPALQDAGAPWQTTQEVPGYVWDTAGGRKTGDKPVKKHDHGMDALRYAIAFLDGPGQSGAVDVSTRFDWRAGVN